ncbi:hypothetical protein Avbf_17867 [Armadillidium vulgare]|nr:hypothetical protein Avbf_17867 [Armadillidium vulgare]
MLKKINWMGHTFYIGNFIINGDADNKPIFVSTSVIWIFIKNIQFSLPSFSPALADYLQGKATQSRIHYYRKLFVSELSVYLKRKRVTRKEEKVFVCETTSVDEAYNLLQTLPLKLWQHTQLKKALFITKDLRFRLQAEETLPDYLLVDSILCYEIGLRLGSNINSLMTAAKTIIRKLHRIEISSIDALIDYLSEGDQRLVSASEIDPFPEF